MLLFQIISLEVLVKNLNSYNLYFPNKPNGSPYTTRCKTLREPL